MQYVFKNAWVMIVLKWTTSPSDDCAVTQWTSWLERNSPYHYVPDSRAERTTSPSRRCRRWDETVVHTETQHCWCVLSDCLECPPLPSRDTELNNINKRHQRNRIIIIIIIIIVVVVIIIVIIIIIVIMTKSTNTVQTPPRLLHCRHVVTEYWTSCKMLCLIRPMQRRPLVSNNGSKKFVSASIKTRSPATAGIANRPLLFLEHRIPMPELFTVRSFTRVLEAGKYGCPY